MIYSVYEALDKYGFSSLQQKQALENLLRDASILETIENRFPSSSSFNQFAQDILDLVKYTQDRFVIRKGTQERWHVNGLDWMNYNQTGKYELLKTLDMIHELAPQKSETDILCILGSTSPTMKGRINFASSLVKNGLKVKFVVLSAGERYAIEKVDGNLQAIVDYHNLTSQAQVTETHIIKYLFDQSTLNSYPVQVIDTPRGNLPRPTTQTTMLDLASWLKENSYIGQNIIFVSSQPNVLYQQSIISEVFRFTDTKVDFEVVGAPYSGDNIHSVIASLGSFIYVQTPNVLISYNQTISDPEVINLFREIYSSQPLIYDNAFANKLIGLNVTTPTLDEL